MTIEEIRIQAAERNLCLMEDVKCINCKYFGYNNGFYMNSMGDSKCLHPKVKGKTFALNFCKGFKKLD